jgi:hypothetical protein
VIHAARRSRNQSGSQPHPVKHVIRLALIALALITPAQAQSIDPIAYGELFCELRAQGVTLSTARAAAVEAAYRPGRVRNDEDTRAAAQYTIKHCYEAIQ